MTTYILGFIACFQAIFCTLYKTNGWQTTPASWGKALSATMLATLGALIWPILLGIWFSKHTLPCPTPTSCEDSKP